MSGSPVSHAYAGCGVGFRVAAGSFIVGCLDGGCGKDGVAVFSGIDDPFRRSMFRKWVPSGAQPAPGTGTYARERGQSGAGGQRRPPPSSLSRLRNRFRMSRYSCSVAWM
jgi:hypothetical protein